MRKKLLLTIIFPFWLTGNLLQAQQWHYYNPTAWFDINTIVINEPGDIVIGGGQETRDSVQVMFRSSDFGLTWHENPHDGRAPWNKSVAFSDALNGYGVGYDGRIIRSDDGGLNWGWPTTPVNRDFNKIVYAGNGTYFVAGGNKTNDSIQTIVKSSNFGNSWSVIYDTLGPWLKSLYFIDTLKGFAVGDRGVILSTMNGGSTWVSIAAPVQRDFNAITFTNASTGYIVGGTPFGPCRRTILRTVNGGSNWNVLIDTAGGILKDVSFADALAGYSVGDSATVLKTTDGGLNWSIINIDSSLTGTETFNAVDFYDNSFGAIGGKNGVFYVFYNPHIEVYAFGTGQTGITDATLLGGINTHRKIGRYSFIYSSSVNFSSPDSTQGIIAQNDSLILISENIQGLIPDTYYYYYLRAISASDTAYSDTLRFYTGVNPSIVIQTLNASQIRPWSVILNGYVKKFPEPAQLFFEYGTSPAFSPLLTDLIAASPPVVNDTLLHIIQKNITTLQPNNQYFFRLKGVADSLTYYGDIKMFSTGNLPWVITTSATNVTLTSALLNGNISNNGYPTAIKFEYGLTAMYGNEVNAIPDSITGLSGRNAAFSLTGLTPLTAYHYRVKAVNPMGTNYGEDMTFITGEASANTLPASHICISSAQMNASVNANNNPALIKFDYGLTNTYGTEVTANPDSVFGTLNSNASFILAGLISDTTYHYRVKVMNSISTVYGNDVSFYTTNRPNVMTQTACLITNNSALLRATINANNSPASVQFEWGLTPSYGNVMNAYPDSVFGNSDTSVIYQVTHLLQDTTYYYRAKATNSFGTTYGNEMMFTTLLHSPDLQLFPVTGITLNSAVLHGQISKADSVLFMSFEYGITRLFGNQVTASPTNINDSLSYQITAQVTGLQPNTLYYFRLKATRSDSLNFYSATGQFYATDCEIPNCSFELWDSFVAEKPVNWTLIGFTKKVPSYNGTNAVKLGGENNNNVVAIFSGILRGKLDGGIPFNARPDSIVCHVKYDVMAGDTAHVFVLFKLNRSVIYQLFVPMTGTSGGNFMRLSYPLTFPDGNIPDTVIVGGMSTNAFWGTSNPASTLTMDDLSFVGHGSGIEIPNSDFEDWISINVDMPVAWALGDEPLADSVILVSKTTDKVSGNYAILLENKPSATNKPTNIMVGSKYSTYGGPAFPVNVRHKSFNFYAKYLPQNKDTLVVALYLYSNGIKIAGTSCSFDTAVLVYTPFNIKIDYMDTVIIPDSAELSVQMGPNDAHGNSKAWIDHFSFDGFLYIDTLHSIVPERLKYILLNIYPNPANDRVNIEYSDASPGKLVFSVYDIFGKLLFNNTEGISQPGIIRKQVDISAFPSGIYLISVASVKSISSSKLIIQK